MNIYFDEKLTNQIKIIKEKNQNLAKLLKEIAKKEKPGKIIKAEFSFGDSIFEKGKLSSSEFPSDLAFALVIERGLEVYIQGNESVTPVAALEPGQTFSLVDEHNLLPLSMLNISSGARSLFLYPKITNFARYCRLARRHDLSEVEPPRHLEDHWGVFKEIIYAQKSPWKSTVLFFGQDWIKENSAAGEQLYQYLHKSNSPNFQFFRKKLVFEVLMSQALDELSFKPDPFLTDNLKHLFAITSKFLPGHVVADDELLAPIKLIQDAFLEHYQPKHAPIILVPGYAKNERVCYHSLHHSMLLEYAPQQRRRRTHILHMEELLSVFARATDHFNTNFFPEMTELFNAIFYFFHPQASMNDQVAPTNIMIDYDPVLKKQIDQFSKSLPGMSAFTSQGCISICQK